jgi:hypothetical protein
MNFRLEAHFRATKWIDDNEDRRSDPQPSLGLHFPSKSAH